MYQKNIKLVSKIIQFFYFGFIVVLFFLNKYNSILLQTNKQLQPIKISFISQKSPSNFYNGRIIFTFQFQKNVERKVILKLSVEEKYIELASK